LAILIKNAKYQKKRSLLKMLKHCIVIVVLCQVVIGGDDWTTNPCRKVGRQRCVPGNGGFQTCNGFTWSKLQKCPESTKCAVHPESKGNILCKRVGNSCKINEQDRQTCRGKDGFVVCDNGIFPYGIFRL